MKQLNFSISDSAHAKLEKIKLQERLANNSEAVEFLIDGFFRELQKRLSRTEAIKLGVRGQEMRK